MALSLDVLRARAARDLEWHELLEVVARACASEVGAARVRALWPADSLAEARDRMQLTAEALMALAAAEAVPSQSTMDLAEVLELLRRGAMASGEELAGISKMLVSARALRAYAAARRTGLPRLASALDSDAALEPLARELARSLDEKGNVLDAASTALRDARRRSEALRSEIAERMRKLARRFADVLRDDEPIERDGRHALSVRADAHRRVEGIVLGASSTGATLYVEPPEITALQNRRTLANAEIEREVARVLAELSARACALVDALVVAWEACVAADVLAALSSWAQACRGIALGIGDEPRIDLRGVRHPLLVAQGVAVVRNDVKLEAGQALVLSGPNAGGKTVALKCTGLAVWMARAGIPLPVAEDSTIGWYAEVLTDIGDAQSLERSLSTFSAEVMALGSILEVADERTLVLLDEVAGGTDPEEGAALASAVLEGLVARRASVAVTTHYERLKELAADHPGFINGSVGFDFDAMRPTFELTIGTPGASSALAVAQRFGLPLSVIDRARELLSVEAVRREELIADLERQRTALAAARASAERDAKAAEELLAAADEERRVARDNEKKRLEREAADLSAKVRQARAQLRAFEEELAGAGDKAALKQAERHISDAARLVSLDGALTRAARGAAAESVEVTAEIRPGMMVHVERLGTIAEVIEAPDRDHVRVQAGAFSLRVPLTEVRVDARPRRKQEKAPEPLRSPPAAREAAIRTSDNTCNLRGQRVDEALGALDVFIDQSLRVGGRAVAFVLHGHGTGALRRAVREHLALHGHVRESRPASLDEGGDAFTVFWLKD